MTRHETLELLRYDIELAPREYRRLEIGLARIFQYPFPHWLSFNAVLKQSNYMNAFIEHGDHLDAWVPRFISDYWDTVALIHHVFPGAAYASGYGRGGVFWGHIDTGDGSFHAEHSESDTWALIQALLDASLHQYL